KMCYNLDIIVKKVQELPTYKIFDIGLFISSVFVALLFVPLEVDLMKYLMVSSIYLVFSIIYSSLRIQYGNGTGSYDYGVNYSQSLALFAGPLGLLFFEIVHRFIIFFQRTYAKTADEDELTDTLYNIGSFTLYHTVGYLFFFALYPYAQSIPFGFFLLFFVSAIIVSWQADTLLLFALYLSGNIRTWSEVVSFFKKRSILDTGKVAITNGLLFYFVMENHWDMLIVFFIMNYIVSKSFLSKHETIQNELERDRFREMAYTDFMTGLSNRAMMDKQMVEINGTNEVLAIVVADIDKFKQINDSYNHAIGDRVIQHFADILKSHTSEEDCVFRSGGEEFTLFLRGRSYEECLEFLESIRSDVSAHPAIVEHNGAEATIPYTASFGLYFNKMTEELPMERAYIYADQLLLEAKDLGRNRVNVSDGQRVLIHS
ncbi:MAG: GGDEF domain-containing protein, partial [Paenisporosarcina sp.]